jgi:hypothetical protein
MKAIEGNAWMDPVLDNKLGVAMVFGRSYSVNTNIGGGVGGTVRINQMT